MNTIITYISLLEPGLKPTTLQTMLFLREHNIEVGITGLILLRYSHCKVGSLYNIIGINMDREMCIRIIFIYIYMHRSVLYKLQLLKYYRNYVTNEVILLIRTNTKAWVVTF